MAEVLIVGAGPTGLTLAAELALAGVEVAVVERRMNAEFAGTRAGGLHARTIEMFDQRGVASRFLAEGQKAQVAGFAGVIFDLHELPTRHPYGLGLWQTHTERILTEWVGELGVAFHRGQAVTGFTEDEDGVEVALADGSALRAGWLVGCDGGRSAIRKMAGIDFPGHDATTSYLIAEVETTEEPPLGNHFNRYGVHSFGRADYEIRDGEVVYADHGPVRVMVTEPTPGGTGEPTLEALKALLVELCGTDYGAHSPKWVSRFGDATRQAAAYRKGRVLLAGDAAHIHSPVGGQGMNTGIQDAMNLGWKLGQVVRGVSPESLLDTYHAERHPIGARVLETTMAAVALYRPDERSKAAKAAMAETLALPGPRRMWAARMSGLDVRYDLGGDHPLVGRRMPDLKVETADGPVRVFELLHAARPVLLVLGGADGLDLGPWAERVRRVEASYAGVWDLPDAGEVPAPEAVLIRPDGHVAWVGEGGDAGLAEALERWAGPAG